MSKVKRSLKTDCVIRVLQENRVVPLDQLMRQCQCSRMTVFNALRSYGYFSSYNYNAGFYTLADTPQFDQNGLWQFDQIRFSRFGNLNDTLVELLEHSDAGYTAAELDQLLGVQCRHLLSRLSYEEQIAREKLGRSYVYFATRRDTQSHQKEARAVISAPAAARARPMLPPGFTARTVIRTLVVAIEEPKASPRQLAARLRQEQTEVTAGQVRAIFDYYDLSEKKGS